MARKEVVASSPTEGEPAQKWKLTPSELKDMLKEANERWTRSYEVDGDNDTEAREDVEFVWVKGHQWPKAARDSRNSWRQPCLEASQLTQFIKQVVNDQRQNRPGIRISAASGDASEETAEILQGMVRHIEYDSRAESVYDTMFEHAVTAGRGYCRVVTDYEGPDSFNQKIIIRSVPDFQSVRIDPNFSEPDGSDKQYAFVLETVRRKEFEKLWPKASMSNWDTSNAKWFPTADDVVIADYYRRVCTKRKLVMLSNGASGWKDALPSEAELAAKGVSIVGEREADDWRVEWFKLAGGQQCLEQYEWRGTIVPVIQVAGDEMYVNGKRTYQGLIRRVRDLQKAYNYLISAAMERVALAPKAPWVMAEGQDEGYEQDWKNANQEAQSRLVYRPKSFEGMLVPPPQRQAPVAAEMGLFQQAEALKQDIKSVLGMYENSLGMKSQETSGRAIIAREKQGDNATFNFVDNLSRGIALVGRIAVELVPHTYDTERTVGIVGDDDTKSTAVINQAMPPQPGQEDGAMEAIYKNNVTEGKYAVAVECGPSYATKRKESADTLTQLIQAFPPVMQVAGDLVMRAQEIPDAPELGDRMKHLLLPAVQQELAQKKAEDEGQPQIPPEAQQQMQQMQQQMQQMQEGIQMLQQENQQLKAGSAEKAAAAQAKAQVDAQSNHDAALAAEAQAQRDAAAADHQRQLDAQAAEHQAGIDAQLEIRKAEIAAKAKIEVARIMAKADIIIADMKPEPKPAPHAPQ